MTADRRDDEPVFEDEDRTDEDPSEVPSWAQATAEMVPEEPEAPEHPSRETAELSQAALLDIEDALPAPEPQLSVEDVALEARAGESPEVAGPWDEDVETGEFEVAHDEEGTSEEPGEDFSQQPTQVMDGAEAREMPKRGPPPAPPDADEHPGPPPTLDVPDDLLGGQWRAERRSIRRPHAKLSGEAINQALRVADVDSRPLQKRERDGQVDPWQTFTPGAGLEGEIAMEVLGQVRRGTQRAEAVRGPRFGPLWWAGAVVVIGLMAAAAVLLYRTQTTAERVLVEPVEPVEVAEPEVPTDETLPAVDRRELRSQMFAAFRKREYAEAVNVGERLETDFYLDWEAEFILAEASRLSRLYDDAIRRYGEFIRRYPKNVRNDDAHFWMGEAMRLQGNLKGARRHYQAVVDNRRSNMRKLAKKRLAQMK